LLVTEEEGFRCTIEFCKIDLFRNLGFVDF